MREIGTLQYGRGLAALLVCLFHYPEFSQRFFGPSRIDNVFVAGHSGVEFFFILSGFIIFTAHHKDIGEPDYLSTFLSKRAVRIVPIFWLIVIPIGIATLLLSSHNEERQYTVSTFLADIALIPREGALTLPPAWTLQHEFVFYLLFATLIFSRRIGLTILLVWQFACLAKLILGIGPESYLSPINKFLGSFNLGFGIGMMLAFIFHRFDIRRARLAIVPAAAVAIVGLGVCFYLEAHDSLPRYQGQTNIIYFTVWAILILWLLSVANKRRPLLDASLGVLGGASYVLYLIHEPFASALYPVMTREPLKRLLTAESAYWISIVTVITAAIIIHLIVEKPLLRWLGARMAARKRRRCAVASGVQVEVSHRSLTQTE